METKTKLKGDILILYYKHFTLFQASNFIHGPFFGFLRWQDKQFHGQDFRKIQGAQTLTIEDQRLVTSDRFRANCTGGYFS